MGVDNAVWGKSENGVNVGMKSQVSGLGAKCHVPVMGTVL